MAPVQGQQEQVGIYSLGAGQGENYGRCQGSRPGMWTSKVEDKFKQITGVIRCHCLGGMAGFCAKAGLGRPRGPLLILGDQGPLTNKLTT